jgi:hypothetical protein
MNDVNSQGSLVRYEAAHRALYATVSVDEVKDIRDRSLAMEIYAYQQRDAQLVAWSVELKERAGRRLGEVMDEERRAGRLAKGGAEKGVGRRGKNAGLPETRIPTLADHGIDKNLADKAGSWRQCRRTNLKPKSPRQLPLLWPWSKAPKKSSLLLGPNRTSGSGKNESFAGEAAARRGPQRSGSHQAGRMLEARRCVSRGWSG